jgi:hypothetical protein
LFRARSRFRNARRIGRGANLLRDSLRSAGDSFTVIAAKRRERDREARVQCERGGAVENSGWFRRRQHRRCLPRCVSPDCLPCPASRQAWQVVRSLADALLQLRSDYGHNGDPKDYHTQLKAHKTHVKSERNFVMAFFALFMLLYLHSSGAQLHERARTARSARTYAPQGSLQICHPDTRPCQRASKQRERSLPPATNQPLAPSWEGVCCVLCAVCCVLCAVS